MKYMYGLYALFLMNIALAQEGAIGIFKFNKDIGNPKNAGATQYDPSSQTYTLKGSGYNIWFERDEFNYAYNKVGGDFIITANFEFIGQGKDGHRKIGFMVRESDDDKAASISAALHGDGLTVLQWRELRGAYMRDPEDEIFPSKSNYNILQLERAGKNIIMRAAHTGEPLQVIGSHEMPNLKDSVLVGLFICSHNPDIVEQAKAWNVRIDRPVSDDYNPGREGWLGCRMETMNVFDGKRRVIFEKPDRFEAPNWMPDGKKLLFNMNGFLFKIPIDGGELEKLNTDFANRNNNDHGISFNGKLLAISHQREGLPGGGSSVHIVPIEGGTPRLLTEETPSYFHGWAPNNKEVVYVATRKDNPTYDIYRKSIDGGNEVALTNTGPNEHVDGCEYSPDGKYIYYNGSQSGTMQVWRMKPDGSAKEQITFDENNNWFPHISPDGKWMVYISFAPEVPVNSHPSYKRVELKLMPVAGGAPRVIAYLYGGQGTINVASWAPDSKQIAFVSNSGERGK
jgi:Tol biopolymer transport system component